MEKVSMHKITGFICNSTFLLFLYNCGEANILKKKKNLRVGKNETSLMKRSTQQLKSYIRSDNNPNCLCV